MRMLLVGLFLAFFAAPGPASAHEVTIDSRAADAVLASVADPALSLEEAQRVARLPANAMLIRKTRDFTDASSEARFVEELLAAARGTRVDGRALFKFDDVKRDRAAIAKALAEVRADEPAMLAWLKQRVQAFSPPGPPLKLRGFLIAGGGSTGFAFGGEDFYLNIAHFADDAGAVKVVVAHELYHAIQGAAVTALGGGTRGYDEAGFAKLTAKPERDRYLVESFLINLLDEGAATYVGDPALLTGDAKYSRTERERLEGQLRRMERLTHLLDMSLVALTAERPVAYDKAYAVSFYGPDQPLYYLGYTMAKAIAAKKGENRLGALITGSGCAFTREYLGIAESDPSLPKLGADTVRLVGAHCS